MELPAFKLNTMEFNFERADWFKTNLKDILSDCEEMDVRKMQEDL